MNEVGNDLQTNARQLLDSAWQQLEVGNLKSAVVCCQTLNSEYPQAFEGWAVSSQVALRLGHAEQSLTFIERAIKLAVDEGPLCLFKAQTLFALKRLAKAIEYAKKSAFLSPNDAVAQNNVATFISLHCRDHIQAVPYYRRALELAPDNSQYRFNLAAVLRFVGQLDEAELMLDQVIEQKPDYGEAWLIRADLRKQSINKNHCLALNELLESKQAPFKNDIHLHYALAKEYEDLGEYKSAFTALKAGADLRRKGMNYDVQQDIDTIAALIKNFTAEWFSQSKANCSSEEPIFIIGLPRTGTTLVERILSSHKDVFAAGELNDFALTMVNHAQKQGGTALNRDELIKASTQLNFANLGQTYLENTRPFTGHSKHFIDKLPFNFLYCGLIAKAFPNAKIIHVQRSPMSSCYAMYKRLFKQAYPMSYHLDDLGRYYLAYRRLMSHWQALMPERIHQIQYEDLVANQTNETKRLLHFCDLPWQEDVLHFEQNVEPSTTASASQIRQPIYRSSLAQWRQYEQQLMPLIKQLRQGGIDLL